MKNILVVDDSALMRRIACDIINADSRYCVKDTASDGLIALKLLEENKYDLIILDVNMPHMNGIDFLKELQRRNMPQRVIMFSTDTVKGADITIQALELGALDFIHKPNNIMVSRKEDFRTRFFEIIDMATKVPLRTIKRTSNIDSILNNKKNNSFATLDLNKNQENKSIKDKVLNNDFDDKSVARTHELNKTKKIVAIASSTGGPKALQHVIPILPKDLNAPVMIVQHMPAGFTASLAQRLDSLSELQCSEAVEGEPILKGHVYLACGGKHLKANKGKVVYGDEPAREGVKPCANYMYESLVNGDYDEIICVVMTGMGADGTKGIVELSKHKKLHIIAQSEETCTVYGMPKNIVETGLVNQIVDLDDMAKEIYKKVNN